MAKYFTREEAEALLPQIEPLLLELQQRYQALLPCGKSWKPSSSGCAATAMACTTV